MSQEQWLSTDEAIHETIGYCLKLTEGAGFLSIRCPDAEIEAKVIAYLKSKRAYPRIDTYIGGINDPVKAMKSEGAAPRSGDKAPKKKGNGPRAPVKPEMIEEEAARLEQIADDKHDAQMADLTPDDELGGLV